MIDVKGRGKSKEAVNNLNLVPFIDLFSTLILFLMATAVFDQLASVPVNMGSNDTPESKQQVDTGKMSGKKITSTVLVTVTDSELVLSDSGKQEKFPLDTARRGNFQVVTEFMQKARAAHQDLRELVVNSTDKAKYGDVVSVMDEALAKNFDQLVVTGEED